MATGQVVITAELGVAHHRSIGTPASKFGARMTQILLSSLLVFACLQSVITQGQPTDCRSLAENGQCTFYTNCVEVRVPCGSSGYAVGYGYHFCNAFEELRGNFNQEVTG